MSTSTSSLPPGKDPPKRPPNPAQELISSPSNPHPVPPERHDLHDSQPIQSPLQQETSADSSNAPRPDFSPFFTLISDSASQNVHHPVNVHYIFSDDDTDVLTSACLHMLTPPTHSNLSSPSSSHHRSKVDISTSSSSISSSSRKPPRSQSTPKKREERFIVLDINATGDKVVSAHSLTPSWQLLSTEITKAPTWDGAEEEDVQSGGLMLKIEGTDGATEEDGLKGDEDAEVAMQALMESFDAKMSMLRKVVEAGGQILEPRDEE